jgi:hypothetical protein
VTNPTPAPVTQPTVDMRSLGASATERPRPEQAAPTREEITRRAYQIYVQRGLKPGSPEGDWLQAERELYLERAGLKPTKPSSS